MATTTTQSAAVAAPPALSILPTSRTTHRSQSHSSESQSSSSRSSTSSSTTTNKNNNNTTNTVISQPIKIPLSERFSSQTSTGSADSGVIVSSASQQQLQQLQLPPPRSSSGSLSLPQAPPGGKWRQKQLLLSQDSGIENGVATRKSGQANTSGGSSKAEKGGGCSSESLESGGAVAENPPRIRAASALELSTSASASSSSSSGTNILRSRIKYKSTNSTGTQGFDVEDRIDEVDICDDDEDEDDVVDVDVDDEEDDGVNVDDVEEADNQSDSQSGIIINLKSQEQQESEDQSQPEGAPGKPSAGGLPPPDQAELTVAAALARRRDAKSLATDGHIYFPLLKISEDPHIDAKLINRKDGLQDTMYYLDEFGSPKLREKFARKQKQLLAKQQKQLLKRERRSEEQRKKRNTTVASNLAASGGVDTKDEHQSPHCDSSIARSKHNSVPPIRIQEDPLVVGADLAEDEDEMADGHVKMRRHSHDNHYDSQQSSRRTIAQVNTTTTRPANQDQDQDQDIEQGAEPALLEDSESPDHSKTSQNKLARTQSCVSWTKVVQKFKNILGKPLNQITPLKFIQKSSLSLKLF